MGGESRLDPFGVRLEGNGEGVESLDVEHLRELFHREGLVVLRGFKAFDTADGFADWCGRFGEVEVWPFGRVLELVQHENPADHIFDHGYVPMHWDGMYRPRVAQYQIFHCVHAPPAGAGGRTTFSHTPRMLANATDAERELWRRVTGTYMRKMVHYDSKTVSPVVTRHPFRDYEVVRYNEPPNVDGFVNPPELHFDGVAADELPEFHRSLQASLHAPANFLAHVWRDGDVVLADNFTLLHGREAYASDCARHIRRVHVNSTPPFANPALVSHRE